MTKRKWRLDGLFSRRAWARKHAAESRVLNPHYIYKVDGFTVYRKHR